MKRAPALHPLSHDHHRTLVQCMRLRRATAEDAASVRADFLAHWQEEVAAHFRIEEELLLPAYARHGDARDEAVVQALCDHVEIRRDVAALADAADADPAALHALAERLDAHVRHEERVLFPLVEAALPGDELAALGEAIAAAEARARG